MRKYIYGSFILVLAILLLVLFANERRSHDDLSDQFLEVQEERSDLKEKNQTLEDQVEKLEGDIKALESNIRDLYRSLVKSQVALVDGRGLLEIPSNTGDYEDYTFMYIEPVEGIRENIDLIIENLTTYYFIDLKMTFMDLDEDNILHINLVEEEETDPSWYPYFAGSTGGYITDLTMVESFLQRNYSGPWIKGVNFYFNGEDEYLTDHVSMFMGIYERSEDYFNIEPID